MPAAGTQDPVFQRSPGKLDIIPRDICGTPQYFKTLVCFVPYVVSLHSQNGCPVGQVIMPDKAQFPFGHVLTGPDSHNYCSGPRQVTFIALPGGYPIQVVPEYIVKIICPTLTHAQGIYTAVCGNSQQVIDYLIKPFPGTLAKSALIAAAVTYPASGGQFKVNSPFTALVVKKHES